MARPVVMLDLAGSHALARDLVAGGVFVPAAAIAINTDCELVVTTGAGDELRVPARVVYVDANGAGLQLECDAELKQKIAELAAIALPTKPELAEPEPADAEPDPEPEQTDAERKIALNVHERLRGLTLAQQVKMAHTGETSERIVLERIYGKTVWEGLLRNPRITGPEVARIARMGQLPKILVEQIVNNGGWLQIGEVRRALLTNPRLGADQILRILRVMPKAELKLATLQTAYSAAVREAARRLLRDD